MPERGIRIYFLPDELESLTAYQTVPVTYDAMARTARKIREAKARLAEQRRKQDGDRNH